ncbi:LrgB family protein [Polyangium aurulentum]|uniref:LrgB family protein n=1 Tax=Polyangium aurulentum TaxID=2567896 RepID=UPI0010AEC1F8|nr:LrgB family protein [Polyangium aurulentum]UQA55857.1 LrgB family protein [Polyangium aurulentum]
MTLSEAMGPLGWPAITLLCYCISLAIHARSKQHPALSPVVVTAALVILVLVATRTPHATYAEAVRPIHLMLGPATVALAVPVYRQASKLKGVVLAAAAAIVCGSLAAAVSAMLIARSMGAASSTVRSLAPKSVTTPIAIAVSESIGGNPSTTSVFVIVTGLLGALAVPGIFRLLRVEDRRARGIAIGVAAHGIGTARAFTLGDVEGAFATLGMGLGGSFVPTVLPWIVRWLEGSL